MEVETGDGFDKTLESQQSIVGSSPIETLGCDSMEHSLSRPERSPTEIDSRKTLDGSSLICTASPEPEAETLGEQSVAGVGASLDECAMPPGSNDVSDSDGCLVPHPNATQHSGVIDGKVDADVPPSPMLIEPEIGSLTQKGDDDSGSGSDSDQRGSRMGDFDMYQEDMDVHPMENYYPGYHRHGPCSGMDYYNPFNPYHAYPFWGQQHRRDCHPRWCERYWCRREPCPHQRRRYEEEEDLRRLPWMWNQRRAIRGNRGDEEDVSTSFSLALEEAEPTGMGAGLSNLGNTCFMNAILQCFTHTVPLVEAVRSCNHATPCAAEGFCVLCALREHINLCLTSSGKIVAPAKLFDNLDQISSIFRRYQQEDAHEFLQCLLDRLDRCLKSNSADDDLSLLDKNMVERVFGGRLVSKLRCCNCGHISHKYEPLIDLSLEIEEVDTLQSALESFTNVETIEDSEKKFTCENCKEEASREKQLMLDQVPTIAALHLKRFKTDGISVEKIGKLVEFPLELDFEPYTDCEEETNVDLKYQLYAIVVHNGLSPTSGHYFCYIRSSPNTWHKLDDSKVKKIKEQSVLEQAAYILFYAKEGTPWFSSFFESEKLCVDSNISSTSPKSVLDNVDGDCSANPGVSKLVLDGVDGECPLKPNVANIDNNEASVSGDNAAGTSSHFPCGTMNEEVLINDSRKETLEISTQISLDTPMVDISLPLGVDDIIMPPLKESNCNKVSDSNGRTDALHPSTPPRSSYPETSSGVQEATYSIPRDHLKVQNRVNGKKSSKRDTKDSERDSQKKDLQREAAARYCNRHMHSSRSMRILALLPRTSKKKLKSSPCKRSSPGCRGKPVSPVVGVMR